NHNLADNLGVGDFDLADRAYQQMRNEWLLRASTTGSIRKSLYNEFRFQLQQEDTAADPRSRAPAVLVLNAFNTGGAQLEGDRAATAVTVEDDLDIAVGKHAWRTGLRFDGGRYRTDELRNGSGTFTFADLAAYDAGTPTTFTRNIGDPDVSISQVQ